MKLIQVNPTSLVHLVALCALLDERTPEQSISHKSMPTFREHCDFVRSDPYYAWYLVHDDAGVMVGTVYLTKQREIGISILERYRRAGYGRRALLALMELHPGKFLANINPSNTDSIKFFERFGFRHIQNTYEL
jgi:RimJ/RimL family protein N-acetyltransferase